VSADDGQAKSPTQISREEAIESFVAEDASKADIISWLAVWERELRARGLPDVKIAGEILSEFNLLCLKHVGDRYGFTLKNPGYRQSVWDDLQKLENFLFLPLHLEKVTVGEYRLKSTETGTRSDSGLTMGEPPAKKHQFSVEDLANRYVVCLLDKSATDLTQYQLGIDTGVSQSTWNRYFIKEEFWKKVRDEMDRQINLVSDGRKAEEEKFNRLVHARAIADDRLQDRSNRYRAGKETHPEPDQFEGNSGPGNSGIDDGVVQNMSRNDLIREIILLDPGYTRERLDGMSKEALVALFDTFQ
jgi:hypothetical protein